MNSAYKSAGLNDLVQELSPIELETRKKNGLSSLISKYVKAGNNVEV